MNERGIDVSHWNIWEEPKKAKGVVDYAQIKLSQGSSWRDPLARSHREEAISIGAKIGYYHFMTNDPADEQADNFEEAILEMGKDDLPPWLDFEPFFAFDGEIYSEREFRLYYAKMLGVEMSGIYSNEYDGKKVEEFLIDGESYQLTYPDPAILDVVGRRLLKSYKDVAIYTNLSIANSKLSKDIWGKRYQISLAQWKVQTPTTPKSWEKAGKKIMNWQRGVFDGAEYGFRGQIDVNAWGAELPFPGDPLPVPSAPARVYIQIDGGQMRSFVEDKGE